MSEMGVAGDDGCIAVDGTRLCPVSFCRPTQSHVSLWTGLLGVCATSWGVGLSVVMPCTWCCGHWSVACISSIMGLGLPDLAMPC
jgi:hypothetical protein